MFGCKTERTGSDDESGDEGVPTASWTVMSAQGTSVITTAVNLFVRECEGSSPTWPINTPTGDVCTFHGTITAQVRMETIM